MRRNRVAHVERSVKLQIALMDSMEHLSQRPIALAFEKN